MMSVGRLWDSKIGNETVCHEVVIMYLFSVFLRLEVALYAPPTTCTKVRPQKVRKSIFIISTGMCMYHCLYHIIN